MSNPAIVARDLPQNQLAELVGWYIGRYGLDDPEHAAMILSYEALYKIPHLSSFNTGREKGRSERPNLREGPILVYGGGNQTKKDLFSDLDKARSKIDVIFVAVIEESKLAAMVFEWAQSRNVVYVRYPLNLTGEVLGVGSLKSMVDSLRPIASVVYMDGQFSVPLAEVLKKINIPVWERK